MNISLEAILAALDEAAHECATATAEDLPRLQKLSQSWAKIVETGKEFFRAEDEAHEAALVEGAEAHAIQQEKEGNDLAERLEIEAEERYAAEGEGN